jgi:hypothetical protein
MRLYPQSYGDSKETSLILWDIQWYSHTLRTHTLRSACEFYAADVARSLANDLGRDNICSWPPLWPLVIILSSGPRSNDATFRTSQVTSSRSQRRSPRWFGRMIGRRDILKAQGVRKVARWRSHGPGEKMYTTNCGNSYPVSSGIAGLELLPSQHVVGIFIAM